jgi:hypothetical protein
MISNALMQGIIAGTRGFRRFMFAPRLKRKAYYAFGLGARKGDADDAVEVRLGNAEIAGAVSH